MYSQILSLINEYIIDSYMFPYFYSICFGFEGCIKFSSGQTIPPAAKRPGGEQLPIGGRQSKVGSGH